MAEPPSYEESASEYGTATAASEKGASRDLQRFNIREEVGTSRAQHVATVVSKLLPQIRERARQGLSKTSLLLLPSDQDYSLRGQVVGYSDDDRPVLIQMEGPQDSLQFWTQREAIAMLQEQMLAAISDNIVVPRVEDELPARPTPVAKSSSFFGRKRSRQADVRPATPPKAPPVSVRVQLDEVSFRSETEYGLFETLRGQAVLVVVEVR